MFAIDRKRIGGCARVRLASRQPRIPKWHVDFVMQNSLADFVLDSSVVVASIVHVILLEIRFIS